MLTPHHRYCESFSITLIVNPIAKWFNTCFTNFMWYPLFVLFNLTSKIWICFLSFTTLFLCLYHIYNRKIIYILFSQSEKCSYIYWNETISWNELSLIKQILVIFFWRRVADNELNVRLLSNKTGLNHLGCNYWIVRKVRADFD